MSKRILMVCLGNICRSPTAEAVLRAKALAKGIAVEVDGAGTGGWHVGNSPHPPMVAAAGPRGYDLSPLRARQFSAADFGRFDLILAMDESNRRDIESLRPPGNDTPVRLLLSYAKSGPRDVPDPYYAGGYDKVIDLIEDAVDALLGDPDQARQ